MYNTRIDLLFLHYSGGINMRKSIFYLMTVTFVLIFNSFVFSFQSFAIHVWNNEAGFYEEYPQFGTVADAQAAGSCGYNWIDDQQCLYYVNWQAPESSGSINNPLIQQDGMQFVRGDDGLDYRVYQIIDNGSGSAFGITYDANGERRDRYLGNSADYGLTPPAPVEQSTDNSIWGDFKGFISNTTDKATNLYDDTKTEFWTGYENAKTGFWTGYEDAKTGIIGTYNNVVDELPFGQDSGIVSVAHASPAVNPTTYTPPTQSFLGIQYSFNPKSIDSSTGFSQNQYHADISYLTSPENPNSNTPLVQMIAANLPEINQICEKNKVYASAAIAQAILESPKDVNYDPTNNTINPFNISSDGTNQNWQSFSNIVSAFEAYAKLISNDYSPATKANSVLGYFNEIQRDPNHSYCENGQIYVKDAMQIYNENKLAPKGSWDYFAQGKK